MSETPSIPTEQSISAPDAASPPEGTHPHARRPPAHHAASTWRDFFIHIATIVLGLLIAVGLEQTVEHLHQHYQLRETREALERERKANEKDWADDE